MHVFGGDGDHAAAGHCLLRVDDDVVEDLAQLAGVHFAGPQTGRQDQFGPYAGAREHKGRHVCQQFGNRREPPHRRAALGKGEQLLCKGLCLSEHNHGLVEVVFYVPVVLAVFPRQPHVAENAGQQVVEIVGDAAREKTQGLQVLGLPDFLLHFLPVGNVLGMHHDEVWLHEHIGDRQPLVFLGKTEMQGHLPPDNCLFPEAAVHVLEDLLFVAVHLLECHPERVRDLAVGDFVRGVVIIDKDERVPGFLPGIGGNRKALVLRPGLPVAFAQRLFAAFAFGDVLENGRHLENFPWP